MSNLDVFKDTLNKVLSNFDFFYNEAQFQFNLAWELKRELSSEWDVLLEEKTVQYKTCGGDERRWYTDIIVKTPDEEYIAIELKYKTQETLDSFGRKIFFGQGAEDSGRYDYIWNIYRLEQLVKGFDTVTENDCLENGIDSMNPTLSTDDLIESKSVNVEHFGKYIAGYAIFLTNEPKYWVFQNPRKPIQNYFEFQISEGAILNKKIDWKRYTKSIHNFRGRPIYLKGKYTIKWNNFSSKTFPDKFQYSIVEVLP